MEFLLELFNYALVSSGWINYVLPCSYYQQSSQLLLVTKNGACISFRDFLVCHHISSHCVFCSYMSNSFFFNNFFLSISKDLTCQNMIGVTYQAFRESENTIEGNRTRNLVLIRNRYIIFLRERDRRTEF